ncbi:bifunctional phosphopantothenoylcysteine decarboxylase/phosphopantothenate--cysteine ligase CoaBC [Chlorobium sp.]|jgi:phosphopantothenoylcysteine decarboxylase/phosphopantothenate--cysteine ligase|uniref:bifunctional phosphopantothenoylcysteine decarboxylase/phosphopantothenate--cysteine ligase CoaBC n=1 Tax=Chlorobium sp. TaxID=1095 RepID=UPI003C53F51B|nr:bifunctional phosphopantothenoylcysteine decarboxylase/phosphopantothenate--cysteine ligase CoaBC [Chlorobiaceae bacterium]
MILKGKKIILGISGGIAAYKTPQLVRLLKKAGAEVRVALTASGSRFVSELSLATVSGEPVFREMFPPLDLPGTDFTRHISLGEWADALVIAPATANTIAKLAAGLCDDMLTACFITLRPGKPVLIFPAMDGQMYRSGSLQRNIALLTGQGCTVIEPENGDLASGQCGTGRMPEPDVIAQRIGMALQNATPDSPLRGRRVVVTAGPTREKIDGVRFISNYSSGKMGFALAEAARERGAEVTLITGPVHLDTPVGVERLDVENACEMYEAAKSLYGLCTVFIAAAAVADYRPELVLEGKLKKNSSHLQLNLIRNPDILAEFGTGKRPDQLAVGFALETGDGLEEAYRKLQEKNLDLVAFNTFDRKTSGFEVDTNVLTLIDRNHTETVLPLMQKKDAARQLLDCIEQLMHSGR